ncbi:MAG: alpha/beta hydrolase [Xanthobacteraceae bacterium]
MKWLLVFAVVAYCGVAAVLYATQRSLQYFPETFRTTPAGAGLAEAQEISLDTADGERLIAWHVPPRDGKPVVLYFPGNGASLRWRTDRFRALTADGTGLVALSYRGYGGSSGSPSEAGLMNDAAAAYGFVSARYPVERIVVWGESLGSGVAVALAARHAVGHMVLEAPFTSAVDVGASRYWFLPVRWLMKDQYRSDAVIGQVTAPVLIVHGDRDTVVPFALGERLYSLIKAPKRFVRIAGGSHDDLGPRALAAAREFLATN